MYGWMIEEHQPIALDYQPIRDDYYIEDSMKQYYMEFNDDHLGESRFWDHTFPKTEFAYNNIDHDSAGFSRTLKGIDFVEKSNKRIRHQLIRRGERNSSTRRYDDGIFKERENSKQL